MPLVTERAMSDISLSLKHGRTQEEARRRLADAVAQLQSRFGSLVHRAEWAADHNSVRLSGGGFEVDAWVDAQEVHVVGNLPLLGMLLGPALKQILGNVFQERLT